MNKGAQHIGIRYKDAPPGEFLQVVESGKAYTLLKTIDKKRPLERVLIMVPPQHDEPETLPVEREISLEMTANYEKRTLSSFTQGEKPEKPEKRICKKCDVPMTYMAACCDDRAAGVKEKWYCSQCKSLMKIKVKGE